MALFTGIGDFFRGAFGEDSEEKKRRKQREAQAAAARKQPVPQQRQQQAVVQNQRSTLDAGLNKKPPVLMQNQPTPPPVVAPAPRVTPNPTVAPVPQPVVPTHPAQVKVQTYQNPGVKDVGGYYASDLKVLNQEVAKGDKADQQRIEGLMKSLDNRKKELSEYQNSKGKFNTADLTGVDGDETKPFVAFVKQKRKQEEQLKADKSNPIEIDAGNGNKAKFTVAQYAKYFSENDKDGKLNIVKHLSSMAEKNPDTGQPKDPGAKALLDGLYRNGQLEGDLGDFYQGFIDKSGGGFARAGLRLGQTGLEVLDKVLPGQDQAKKENWNQKADQLDEDYANTLGSVTKSGKSGQSAGTGTKAAIDIATLVGGNATAGAGSKIQEGSKLASLFGKASPRVAKALTTATQEGAQSLVGTVTSAAQTRGKGDEQNLAKDAAISLAIDMALPSASSGIRRLFGGKGDDAAKILEREIEAAQKENAVNVTKQLEGNADADTVPAFERGFGTKEPDAKGAYKAEQSAARGENSTFKDMTDKGLNPGDPNDIPAYQRNPEYRDQVVKDAEDELDKVNQQLDTTPERTIEEYRFNEKQKLAQDIRANPEAKDALIANFNRKMEAVGNLDNLKEYRQTLEGRKEELTRLVQDSNALAAKNEELLTKQASTADEAVTTQQAVNADVAAEQAAKTAPAPGGVVQDAPTQGSPEVEANNAYRVEDVNPDGSKSGDNYTVEFPPESKIQKYRTAKELANSNNSGYVSSASDIVIKDIDGNEVRRMPYDEAVQRYGTSDPEELSHLLANGGAPKGNVSKIEANDGYDSFNKEAGIESGTENLDYLTAQQRLEKLAGNRTLEDLSGKQALRIPAAVGESTQGRIASGVTDAAGGVTGKLIKSQNPILNSIGQTLFAFNKKSTLNNAEKALVEQVAGRRGGQGKLIDQVVENIETTLKGLTEEAQAMAKEKVYKAFELYNNGQADDALQVIKSFSPEERAYFDSTRELNSLRNNLNRTTMSADKIEEYANGMHMPRIFDLSEDDVVSYATSQSKALDLNPAKRRKQLEELSAELQEKMLRDPAQASAIRTDVALHNKAISDYSASVAGLPDAVSEVPAKGFLEIPEGDKFGALSGKYVRRDLAEAMLSGDARFKSDAYKHVNALLEKYQNTFMGKIENGLRQALTSLNPGTRLGNRGANLVQGSLAGFNLPEMASSQLHFEGVLKNGGDEWTRLAQTFGAIDDNQALARVSGRAQEIGNTFMKNRGESYGNVDTAAKVAMFKWRIQKGSTPEEAARFVNRALPNIGNSGEIYSFFSRLPILGVPFRAIQPEVLRSVSSSAARNSVPFLVAMATYTTLQNMSWKDVPEEERKQIQERFGSGQTPFAGINNFFGDKGIPTDKVLPSSWSINAGALFGKDPEGNSKVVDVDPRRLMGMYSINLGGDSAKDSLVDQALKTSPVNIPVDYNNGELSFSPQNLVSSRIASPLWQALIDRDYRGKSVQDPEGKIYNKDGTIDHKYQTPDGKPDQKQDTNRLLQFLGRSYVPQLNDVSNVKDAISHEENFNGQNMNPLQAIGRFFGLKGEEFTDDRLQKMRDTEKYFNEKAEIDNQVKGLSDAEADAYRRLTGYYKLRDQKVPNEFSPGEMRDTKAPQYEWSEDKWKELAAHPDLYQLLVDKKKRESAVPGSDGKTKPLQPEYDERLSESFRKQIIQNKMVAPGDDAELDQRMYSSPEWDYYQNLKDEYKAKAKDYYPQSENDEFTDELVKNQDSKFPTKPDMLKAYSAQYKLYTDGKAEKPQWNDALTAQKEAYNMQTLNWTNEARQKRGLPAITWEVWNNPTFGFDETPSGSGFGFGGGRGGSGGGDVNTLTELTNFGDSVKRFAPIEAEAMPNAVQVFQKLVAGKGGRSKPKLGASSSGRG